MKIEVKIAKIAIWAPMGAKKEGRYHQRGGGKRGRKWRQRVTQGEPKRGKGSQKEPKGSKREAKSSHLAPKERQRATKKHSKGGSGDRFEKGSIFIKKFRFYSESSKK